MKTDIKSNTKNGVLWKKEKCPWSEIKKDMRLQRITMWYLEKKRLRTLNLSQLIPLKLRSLLMQKSSMPYLLKRTIILDQMMVRKRVAKPQVKAYSLFVKILNETKKIAIGKVVLKDKEQLVALRAYQRGLVMHQLKYLDEIRPMDEIGGLDSSQKIDPRNYP